MVSNVDGKELNLSWDAKYQLSNVNVGVGTNVFYDYNVLGQRISRKEISGSTTNTEYYVHEGMNIVADLDADKELLRSYTYAPGYDNIISMTVYEDAETNTYFYIRNHNNSVVALVDEDGVIAESYEYTSYGEVTVFDSNGNELDESALGNRYTFQGREIDWTTGLYNFRARWYCAETGRWLSKDPIGINGGLNQYVFCGNNPVMFVDPEGLTTYVCVNGGHMAILISNVDGGYTDYSFVAKGWNWNWKNIGKFIFESNLGWISDYPALDFSNYDEYYDLGFTDEQECRLREVYEELMETQNSYYNLIYFNCGDMVIGALFESGFLTEEEYGRIKWDSGPTPKSKYSSLINQIERRKKQ